MAKRLWFVNPKRRRHRHGCRCVVCASRRRRRNPHPAVIHALRSTLHSARPATHLMFNPLLKEYGMFGLLNPRRRRHGKHRVRGYSYRRHGKRVRVHGHLSNPRHRRHHRYNPGGSGIHPVRGIMEPITHPVGFLMDGVLGVAGAYVTISVPNAFLPFEGTDIMSKVLRGLTRGAMAALVYTGARRILPRSANAIGVGATIGAAGSFVLDLLGNVIAIGSGDTFQTPGMILSAPGLSNMFSSTAAAAPAAAPATPAGSFVGYGAYTRALNYARVPGGASGMAAYTRPVLPAAAGLTGLGAMYDSGSRAIFGHRIYG